jgi:hypothetical protein
MTPPPLRCSFCNKTQRDVRKLIAGPSVHICDECVDICLDIVPEHRETASEPPPEPTVPPGHVRYFNAPVHFATVCSLCHMPLPLEHALEVHSRGVLCPGCVGAVDAAMAAARDRGEPS